MRAERAGKGNGRVYHIRFTADDGHGGGCTGEVLVGVSHNKKDTPVDDGALYDATVGSVTAMGTGQTDVTEPTAHLIFPPLLER